MEKAEIVRRLKKIYTSNKNSIKKLEDPNHYATYESDFKVGYLEALVECLNQDIFKLIEILTEK